MDPAYLRRKRQKTNGDPVHLLLQHQKNQLQNDHQDDRSNISSWNDLNIPAIKTEPKGSNTSCWNGLNIPAVKTEPKDISNQPFGIYRAPPELTPSPQPLSPSTIYTHNTPSPYSLTPAVTPQGNQQMISPNLQYNTNNAGQQTMDIGDYNAFSQQTQQQQQQQYHENNFGGAGTTHWKTKFDPTAATNNNLINLNNANTYNNMHNLLIPVNAGAQGNGTNGNGNVWNFTHHQNHLQQQYQQHETQNDTVASANNNAVTANNGIIGNDNNNNNNNEHGLSNLLTFDSEQLVCINSEDQQMLRLSTEDLQISNLSIST